MIRVDARKTLACEEGTFRLDFSFEVPGNGIVAVTGRSGSGKTSLLRLMAGLLTPEDGTIRINGETWYDKAAKIDLPAWKRDSGYVFQEYALFPNMTVRENAFYGCRRETFADELLEAAGLADLRNFPPSKLSGGQKQSAALVRALAREPSLLLLDEPFSAVDAELKLRLQDLLLTLHRRSGVPTIIVSHDAEEIRRLADYALLLENGRVAARGSPAKIFPGRREGTCPGADFAPAEEPPSVLGEHPSRRS